MSYIVVQQFRMAPVGIRLVYIFLGLGSSFSNQCNGLLHSLRKGTTLATQNKLQNQISFDKTKKQVYVFFVKHFHTNEKSSLKTPFSHGKMNRICLNCIIFRNQYIWFKGFFFLNTWIYFGCHEKIFKYIFFFFSLGW